MEDIKGCRTIQVVYGIFNILTFSVLVFNPDNTRGRTQAQEVAGSSIDLCFRESEPVLVVP